MRKKVLSILFAIVLIFALKNMSYAASANISCDSEATVGKEITITANVTGVQWNLDLKVNGQTIAKNSELENSFPTHYLLKTFSGYFFGSFQIGFFYPIFFFQKNLIFYLMFS